LDQNFWGTFIKMCNNKDKLAELLGVSPDNVMQWAHLIKENLQKVQKADSHTKQTSVVKTGHEPLSSGDSEGGTVTYPSNTAPTP
jgi:hypothetical protein